MKIKNKSILAILATSLVSIPNGYNALASEINIDDFITINNIETEGDEERVSMIPTSDGGYLVVYTQYNTRTSSDGIVDKYTSKGVKEWTTQINTVGDDSFNSVIELENGNFFVVGRLGNSTGTDSIPDFNSDRIMGVEINKDNGEIISARGLDTDNRFGSGDDVEIKKASDGFIIYSTSLRDGNKYLVKYNDSFAKQWEKTFRGRMPKRVTVTDNEDVLMLSANAGFYESPEAYIQKYSKTGDELLNVTVDKKSSGSGSSYYLHDIIEMNDGSYLVAGATDYTGIDGLENQGGKDSIILRVNSAGEIQLTKGFGIAVDDEAREIISTKDGGYMVVVMADNKDIVTKLDADLNVQWKKEITTNTSASSSASMNISNKMITLKNGAIVVAGIVENSNYKGDLYTFIYHEVDEETKAEEAVNEAVAKRTEEALINARLLVNALPEGEAKERLQGRLNEISPNVTLTPISASANVDIYIKSENMLSLSLDTNSITFDDFGGTENLVEENAVILTVNSSLPYKVNASLATEIQNADKSETINKEILNIKANSESDDSYQHFTAVDTPIEIVSTQEAGNGKTHGIDIMLKGGIPHEKDVYKTTIKFEATQH